jgi:TolB-like protein
MKAHIMKTRYQLSAVPLLVFLLLGCAGSRPTAFLNPEFDFSTIERVAVIPFENLSSDQGMGDYMTRIFITQLLATKTFDIVEPGEVTHFLTTKGVTKTSELTVEQVQELGKSLSVQGVIFGTVGESAQLRSGNLNSQVVSLDTRLVSVETGSTVWSAAVNTGGPGFFARMLGVGEQTRGNAAHAAVKKAIKTLVR